MLTRQVLTDSVVSNWSALFVLGLKPRKYFNPQTCQPLHFAKLLRKWPLDVLVWDVKDSISRNLVDNHRHKMLRRVFWVNNSQGTSVYSSVNYLLVPIVGAKRGILPWLRMSGGLLWGFLVELPFPLLFIGYVDSSLRILQKWVQAQGMKVQGMEPRHPQHRRVKFLQLT